MKHIKKRGFWITLGCVALVLIAFVAGRLAIDMDLPNGLDGRGTPKLAATYGTADYADYEEAAYDFDGGSSLYMSTKNASGSAGASLATQENRKLVRTADLTLSTQSYEAASQRVQELLAEVGGYAESLYERGEVGRRRLTLTTRVPSDRLDAFLAGLEGAGRVTDRSETVTDMTVHYQDNAARLKTLYDKRDRLSELLAQAENVSDLIEIESAISDTQYQIDSYEARQRTIDQQVDLSQVDVTLVEQQPSAEDVELPLGQRMKAGLLASLEWLADTLRSLAVGVVMLLPVAVPVAVIVLIVRRIRNRKKEK